MLVYCAAQEASMPHWVYWLEERKHHFHTTKIYYSNWTKFATEITQSRQLIHAKFEANHASLQASKISILIAFFIIFILHPLHFQP